MRRTTSILLVSCTFAAALASAAETKPAANMSRAPQAFGKPFAAKDAPLPIQQVMADSSKYEGKAVKVSGTVTQVCQKKGCWFEIAEKTGAPGVRIKSADYTIFVPMDSAGRNAVVEGTLKVTTLSQAQAQHLADDGAKGGTAAKVAGPLKEFQLAATTVELN